jgi:hypothetical protein
MTGFPTIGGIRAVCQVILLLAAVLAGKPVLAASTVSLLLSEPSGIYQEAAWALQRELARDPGRWLVRQQQVADRPNLAEVPDGLIVAVGVRALRYALDSPGKVPVFALLVPSITFNRLMADRPTTGRGHPVSVLFLDQPYVRQLQLIRVALPAASRVGILVGQTTAGDALALRSAARDAGLEVRIQPVEGRQQLFSSLVDLTREVDVLLLLPDAQVVSGSTLQALLLQTYQRGLPVVAYATSLVQAGATLGLFATPEQLGLEAGIHIRETPAEQFMSRPVASYPQRSTVEVNGEVARTLGLTLPPVEILGARLNKERGP